MLNRNISARIPHQSPPYGGDSFPPGEAICGFAANKVNDKFPKFKLSGA